MESIPTRRIARYGVAVLASGGALLLRYALMAFLGSTLPRYITYLPAVMLTATFCGLGPGLLATGGAVLLAAYWTFPPAGFGIQNRADAIGLGVFAAMGVGMSVVAGLYRRAERRVEASREMLRQLRAHEEALAQSEQRYRDLVELSPQAILVHSSGGTVVYVNPGGIRLYGARGPGDLVGRAILDLVHPEYRTVIAERIRRVLEQRAQTPMAEAKILRLDGHAVDVEATANRITYDGMPAVQVILMDITERKRMEDALRRQQQWDEALKTIGQAVTSLFPIDAILTQGAESIRRAAGATLAVVRLVDPKTRELVLVAHRGVPEDSLAGGEQIPWGEEVAGAVAASGQPCLVGRPADQRGVSDLSLLAGWAHSLVCLPLQAGNRVLGTLTLGHAQPEFFDSTDLQTILPAAAMLAGAILAERLRLATLKEAEGKALLFRELDHRVRNHLAALISLLHLGAEHSEGGAANRLREMAERVTRLAEVHNLLAGRGLQPVDVRELAEVIARTVLAVLPGQVQVRWTVTGDPVRVPPSRVTAVALVLNELLTNCTKHAFPDRDSGTVTIRVAYADHQLELTVHDDGIGLGPAPRTGLGKTIVETVVTQSLRGTVRFADDTGTEVTIRFPHVEETPEGGAV